MTLKTTCSLLCVLCCFSSLKLSGSQSVLENEWIVLDDVLGLFSSKSNGFTFAVGFLNLEATSFEACLLLNHSMYHSIIVY